MTTRDTGIGTFLLVGEKTEAKIVLVSFFLSPFAFSQQPDKNTETDNILWFP
jgi:hypothetical protein